MALKGIKNFSPKVDI